MFSIYHWYSSCLHASMKCNNFHLKILSLFSLRWWNVNLSISLIQIIFPSFYLHFMKPVGCSLIFWFIMFRVLYISCELQSCSFFLEFSLIQRIVLVFTAVLVEFSDSSSFSQFLGIDFFSFCKFWYPINF